MKGILIINKPKDWTSHDVVAKMRRVLHERRIGHGGTLDPMATGVLPLLVGRATRASEFIEAEDKEYIAGLRLGVVTDTQDTSGNVLSNSHVSVSKGQLIDILKDYEGEREQIPPMYSAVKIGGKKLYEYARAGKTVERPARRINIEKLELLSFDGDDPQIRIVCSKGTYVRTICHEIGLLLGCGGAMSSLVRTRVGMFDIGSAWTVQQVISEAEVGNAEKLLMPVEKVFSRLDEIVLTGAEEAKCRNGARIYKPNISPGRYRVFSESGEFLMVGEAQADGMLVTVKSFFDV